MRRGLCAVVETSCGKSIIMAGEKYTEKYKI